ncbi:MAG: CoA-binding protein [Bacteroidetes bacterium]|nr:CoA-binding protein [Bacteroidota bacterium]
MSNKITVVIGASPNEERYSFRATKSLLNHGHTVFPVGMRAGRIGDLDIITDRPVFQDVDTVTLYVGPANQPAWYDYIISLHPKRLVFNPGTENAELADLARKNGIETVEACTLVMLSIGNY